MKRTSSQLLNASVARRMRELRLDIAGKLMAAGIWRASDDYTTRAASALKGADALIQADRAQATCPPIPGDPLHPAAHKVVARWDLYVEFARDPKATTQQKADAWAFVQKAVDGLRRHIRGESAQAEDVPGGCAPPAGKTTNVSVSEREALREFAKLVEYFTSHEGYRDFGANGDADCKTPAETAIHAMERYSRSLKNQHAAIVGSGKAGDFVPRERYNKLADGLRAIFEASRMGRRTPEGLRDLHKRIDLIPELLK